VESPYVSPPQRGEQFQTPQIGAVRWREQMADDSKDLADDRSSVPVMQQILDNPFILLFIGILIPTLTYIIWGIMELISIPVAQ
jgi:hypothetical protein